jgi:cyclophilin family peptidyl-prolyl cis-trans isomerase
MRTILVAFIFLSLSLGSCQTKYPDLDKGLYAEFITTKGTFVAKLYHDQTPLTVANFVDLAEGTNGMVNEEFKGKKFYNGLTFHRVMDNFMIQGGDPLGDGTGNPGYKFPDEFVDTLNHDRKGILSMANGGPDGNGSQFFITLKDTPWLNGKHSVFGEIVMGMDVVEAIGKVETTQPGNKPVTPVVMNEVNIINKGNVKVPTFTSQMENIEQENMAKEEAVKQVAKEKIDELEALEEQAETRESGLKIYYNKRSKGMKPQEGTKVLMNYAGYFDDGRLFDTNLLEVAERFDVVNAARKAANAYVPSEAEYSKQARLVQGFREGLLELSYGDKATIFVPSHLAYGANGYPGVIPPNTDLIFEIELVGPAQ